MDAFDAWIEKVCLDKFRTVRALYELYREEVPGYPLSENSFRRRFNKRHDSRLFGYHYEPEAIDWIKSHPTEGCSIAQIHREFSNFAERNGLSERTYKSFAHRFRVIHGITQGDTRFEPEAVQWIHENAEIQPISIILRRFNYQAARKKWRKRTRRSLVHAIRSLGYDPFSDMGLEDYTPNTIAQYLGTNSARIVRLIKAKKLRAEKVDGKFYVKPKELYIFCTEFEGELQGFTPENAVVLLLDVMSRVGLEKRRKLLT